MARIDVLLKFEDALRRDDAEAFDALLRSYPHERFHYDGSEQWLTSAIMDGRLAVTKLLVSLGADPAAPKNNTDSVPDPEGPIFNAVCAGHLDMVRYLLDLGAPVNHTIGGRVRCFSLSSAARYGYFDLVRLLVERGAAVNAEWKDRTALDEATRSGEDEIAGYLRSVGGKTAAELARGGSESGQR